MNSYLTYLLSKFIVSKRKQVRICKLMFILTISISFLVIYRSVMEDDSYSRTLSFTNKNMKNNSKLCNIKRAFCNSFSLTPEIVFVIHGNNYMPLYQQQSTTYDCLTIFSTLSYYIITCFHYIMIYFVEKNISCVPFT